MGQSDINQSVPPTRGRRGPYEREARLRHVAYYIGRISEADDKYTTEKQQEALGQFDLEKGQLDAVRAWLWAQLPDAMIDNLIIAEARAVTYIGSIRDFAYTVRVPQMERAIAAAQRRNNLHTNEQLLVNLGNALCFIGRSSDAINYYEQCLSIVRANGDLRKEGKLLGNLGSASFHLGKFHDSLSYFEQFLSISRRVGDKNSEGMALGNLGLVYWKLGQIHTAISCHEQHLSIAREVGDRRSEGRTLGNLGNVYLSLGKMRIAISYYEQDLANAREVGDRQGESVSLGNLGIAYYMLGEIPTAINYCEQHLSIAQEVGDRHGEGEALVNLGMAHYLQMSLIKALAYCETAQEVAEEVRDQSLEAAVLRCLANVQTALGQHAKAQANYAASLTIIDNIGDTDEGTLTRWAYGQFLVRQGERERGIALMGECVAYEQGIGHAQAEEHAALVEHLRSGGELPT